MSIPTDEDPGPRGNVAGTEVLGLIFLETVNIERKSGGSWGAIAMNVPATFEPVTFYGRTKLEPWSHKPLFCLWLPPETPVADGDRAIRADGSRWYIRGAPLAAPMNTHLVALAERATEDNLFAARSSAEPS